METIYINHPLYAVCIPHVGVFLCKYGEFKFAADNDTNEKVWNSLCYGLELEPECTFSFNSREVYNPKKEYLDSRMDDFNKLLYKDFSVTRIR